jgi:hypothetical protein
VLAAPSVAEWESPLAAVTPLRTIDVQRPGVVVLVVDVLVLVDVLDVLVLVLVDVLDVLVLVEVLVLVLVDVLVLVEVLVLVDVEEDDDVVGSGGRAIVTLRS